MGCWMDLVTECDPFWRFLESKLHEIWCHFGLEAQEYAGHILTNSNRLLTDDDVGVSENSVPLNPMVNDHYPY